MVLKKGSAGQFDLTESFVGLSCAAFFVFKRKYLVRNIVIAKSFVRCYNWIIEFVREIIAALPSYLICREDVLINIKKIGEMKK